MAEKFDIDADLVVVGFGGAGGAAALTAARKGARVVVIEKQPEDAHTPSTKMSAGLIMAVNDASAGTDYLVACAGGLVPPEPLRAFAERAAQLKDWLNGLSRNAAVTQVSVAEHPEFAGSESVVVYQFGNPKFKLDPDGFAGKAFFQLLSDAVAEAGAEIMWDASAKRLLRDESGRVTGVAVSTPNGMRHIRGRSGVVLATGGFGYDEAAKLSFLKASPMHFFGNPGNNGDGLRMAQQAGADLWHMGQMVGRGVGAFRHPNGSLFAQLLLLAPPGYVILDRDGRRFAREDAQAKLMHDFYYHLLVYDPHTARYPRIPCYWFFDERRRNAGPLAPTHFGAQAVGIYEWSPDNSKEIESGWIAKGDTIEEAAASAGHPDPAAAAASVADYNRCCAIGTADPFGRAAETMVALDKPPFYCVTLWPGGSNTTGGPRRDAGARVLDAMGDPIPGLFAAGELGQVSGSLYAADGANLGEALCFGQIAAETALSDVKFR